MFFRCSLFGFLSPTWFFRFPPPYNLLRHRIRQDKKEERKEEKNGLSRTGSRRIAYVSGITGWPRRRTWWNPRKWAKLWTFRGWLGIVSFRLADGRLGEAWKKKKDGWPSLCHQKQKRLRVCVGACALRALPLVWFNMDSPLWGCPFGCRVPFSNEG